MYTASLIQYEVFVFDDKVLLFKFLSFHPYLSLCFTCGWWVFLQFLSPEGRSSGVQFKPGSLGWTSTLYFLSMWWMQLVTHWCRCKLPQNGSRLLMCVQKSVHNSWVRAFQAQIRCHRLQSDFWVFHRCWRVVFFIAVFLIWGWHIMCPLSSCCFCLFLVVC